MNILPIQKQKVVIIGHSSTLRLGIVRSVAEAGCEITVIVMTGYWRMTKILRTYKPFDCFSKYISNVYYSHFDDQEELIRLLLDKCRDDGQKVIIIPTNDLSTVALDDNISLLSTHFLFPHITGRGQSVRYWMDKENQKALARSVGLKVPDACVVDIRNKAYEIPADITYPCFTKALVSVAGGKTCFNRCDSDAELRRVLDAIGTKQDVRVLVEDYKTIETEYAVLGFSDGTEVVIPGVVRIDSLSTSHFGVARTGEIMPADGFDELLEQYKSFVRRMGFVGVFDIDFYSCGDEFYFSEINLRPGGSGYAVTWMGVNLPAMLIRHLRGESICSMTMRIDSSASFVNERTCEDDWCSGAISSSAYQSIIDSADISFVRDNRDPHPQKIYELRHRLLPIKKILKKILIH